MLYQLSHNHCPKGAIYIETEKDTVVEVAGKPWSSGNGRTLKSERL